MLHRMDHTNLICMFLGLTDIFNDVPDFISRVYAWPTSSFNASPDLNLKHTNATLCLVELQLQQQ